MTAQQAVLALGTVTLSGCGAGLVLIHDNNPLLKGLNWMGTALVLGGVAAALMLVSQPYPTCAPLANTCILLAFMSCYRADRYLIGSGDKCQPLSVALLAVELVAALLQWSHLLRMRDAILLLSCAVTVQLEMTARLVHRAADAKSRLAARFTVLLMRCLGLANLCRGMWAATGLLDKPKTADPLNLLTYIIFVSAAVGLAFAFFWRTTTKLSLDLEHMASTDPLTRVYNRRVFLNWCESEQARSQRFGIPFSVLMIDFDHFKRVNDTYGHLVGDQVLCAAVERIQDSIRGIDVLCRWGGEEFAVLLPNASEEATQIVAERVRRNVPTFKSVHVRFADPAFSGLGLSASIGAATYHGADDSYEAMLQRADEALYAAKRSGRDRVVLAASPEHDAAGMEATHLVLGTS